MGWCEQHQVDYLFGLARNPRLQDAIAPELAQAQALSDQLQQPVRLFTDLLPHPQELVPPAPRGRQSRDPAPWPQPPLPRHLSVGS